MSFLFSFSIYVHNKKFAFTEWMKWRENFERGKCRFCVALTMAEDSGVHVPKRKEITLKKKKKKLSGMIYFAWVKADI